MNFHSDQHRIEWLASRYLEAIENQDDATQDQLWQLALQDQQLLMALQQVHDDYLEELGQRDVVQWQSSLTSLISKHLKTTVIPSESSGPVTFGDVARELFQHTPAALPSEAYVLNESLQQSIEPLPENLALSKLISFAEAKFGAAPREYWQAFRLAAIKLEMRRASEAEYQLAARKQKPAGGSS